MPSSEGGRPCPPDQSRDPVSKTKRRTIPHWIYKDSTYFLTWRLVKTQAELNYFEREFVAEVLNYFHNARYFLICYVVMNDHVHVMFQIMNNYSVPKLVHSWKSFTANCFQRRFKRKGRVWQEEYYDRIIRNDKQFYRTVNYILNNPKKRWQTENYRWVFFREI